MKFTWNNKRGSGSVILGTVILMVCFFMCLFLMDSFSLFNSAARAQTVVDSAADGAAIGGEELYGINEEKANEIVQTILSENYPEGNTSYNLTVSEDDETGGEILVAGINSIENPLLSPDLTDPSVLIFADATVKIDENYFLGMIDLTGLTDSEIQLVSDNFPSSKRMQSLMSFALSLNTRQAQYSKTYRNSDGYYDCSSFVYACYQAAGIDLGASTAAEELRACMSNDHFVVTTDFSSLQTGDILFYRKTGDTERFMGVRHVAIFLGYDDEGRICTIETRNPGDYNAVGGNIVISTSMSGKTWNLVRAAHFVENP